MRRLAISQLIEWKKSKLRQPLLVRGARQVGKTHLLKTFGEQEYKNYFHFDFEKEKDLSAYFEKNLDPIRIVSELSARCEKKIDPETDLIIFDEIQECPKALNSLKYFCEDLPSQHICSAGSLLGVKLSSESFPVGKVNFLDLYPMTFEEFVMATGNEMTIDLFKKLLTTHELSIAGHHKLLELYQHFLFVGGMPRVVHAYLETRQLNLIEMATKVRETQKNLVESYHGDFAKHAGQVNSMHIVSVFENIPLQLARNIDGSVQRYRFRDVIPNKKSYADLHGPIDWLEKAGLIIKVKICERPEIPLESFCSQNLFKLYLFDVGLLGYMLDIPTGSLLANDLGITKGYLAENFVATELLTSTREHLQGWTGKSAEIEFLRVLNSQVIPVEVKAGTRTHAKSLGVFFEKFSPAFAIKLSARMLDDSSSKKVRSLPLYLAGQLTSWFTHK